MASFEQNAADLTAVVREIRLKRKALAKSIEDEKMESQAIQDELDVMMERKKQIEALIKNYQLERENLSSMITETESTKQKIADSLKHLNLHLKKMQLHRTID